MYPYTQPTAEEKAEKLQKAQASAQRIVDNIAATLRAGGTVMLHSYTKSWQYRGEGHIASFKASGGHLCVKQGKRFVIADGCKIQHYAKA